MMLAGQKLGSSTPAIFNKDFYFVCFFIPKMLVKNAICWKNINQKFVLLFYQRKYILKFSKIVVKFAFFNMVAIPTFDKVKVIF